MNADEFKVKKDLGCKVHSDCGVSAYFHCCGVKVSPVKGPSTEMKLPGFPEMCTYTDFVCLEDSSPTFAKEVKCLEDRCTLVTETQSPQECVTGFGNVDGCVENWVARSSDSRICDLFKNKSRIPACKTRFSEKAVEKKCEDESCRNRANMRELRLMEETKARKLKESQGK